MDAIIFDFDGLILNTELSGFQAWQRVYADYGRDFPRAEWEKNIGTGGMFDPVGHLRRLLQEAGERTLPPGAELHGRHRRYDREILAEMPLMPGVLDRLAEAEAMGLKRAVASNSPAAWLDYHLPRLDLRHRFHAVRTRTDVNDVHKPDPAVYLAACEALGVDPARAVAFEDSLNGVLAAKNAGMYVVAVPNEMTAGMDLSAADRMVESLSAVTLAELAAR